MKKPDYGRIRKQFLKVVEKEFFFTEAFERVLKIEDFKEFREKRKKAIEELGSYAGQLSEIMNAALSGDPKERLMSMAPVYEKSMEILRNYGAFDRSLTLPNNISDRYTERLKGYIRSAIKGKVRRGVLSPTDGERKANEILSDLMSPADFFSLESTKMMDYLDSFKKIRAQGKEPLDPSVLEDTKTRELVGGLAKYNANSAEDAFNDFANYSEFIGKEDVIIEKLMMEKAKLKEKRAAAEEYVLSGLEREKCSNGFIHTLSALDELRRYEGFEDPKRHTFGDNTLLVYLNFMGVFARTMEQAFSRPVDIVDLMKVGEIRSELGMLSR